MRSFPRSATRSLSLLPLAAVLAAPAAQLQAQTPPTAVAPAAAPVAYAEAIERARSLAAAHLATHALPGLSVAVGVAGRTVWSEGFGYADLEQRVPVTPITKFRIGSVSKTVTAAAVGLLLERGRLDLDAPVQRYVPSFPGKRWPITVRQVAGHTAGIRHYASDEFLSSRRYADVVDALAIFAADSLLFEPDTEYEYSTYGWNLISAIVQGAASEPFLRFLRREVLDPLGMRQTVAEHTDSIIPYRVRYYERTEDGRLINAPYVDNSNKWAGGGLAAPPEGLVRFGFGHLDGSLLRPETVEQLWQPRRLRSGESTGYGIGWRTYDPVEGQRAIGHTGGSVGGTTAFLLLPEDEVVVAVVSNVSDAPGLRNLARRTAALFLPAR